MKLMNKIKKLPFEKVSFKNLDNIVGVYIFFDENLKALYVGKSKNLKARLTSYKSKALFGKTKTLIEQVKYFSYLPVNSEIEALLLEADLVKKISPRYNIELKDDKSPLYIRITSEKYPRVLTAKKSDELNQNEFFVGPFPSSETVKNMLRMIRRVFPYSQHTPTKKQCIYAQMGLCSPCPSLIENTDDIQVRKKLYRKYLNNVKLIKRLLLGKLKSIYLNFDKEIRRYIDSEEFEKANEVKKRIETLNYITQNINKPKEYIENPNFLDDIMQQETDDLLRILRQFTPHITNVDRIECYDIAHISGILPTASMVSFFKGKPDKKMYRRFRIYQKNGNNDISSMEEIAKRRCKYFHKNKQGITWEKPNVILVDGGKTQTSAFLKIVEPYQIPVIGLAKRFETLIIPTKSGENTKFVEYKLPNGPAKNLLQRIRNEAHRFARKYHHFLFKKNFLNSNSK